jgi:hypothetical protein
MIRNYFLNNEANKLAGEIKVEPRPSLDIIIPNTCIENTKMELIQYILNNK